MNRRAIVCGGIALASSSALWLGACSGTQQMGWDAGADATTDAKSGSDTGVTKDSAPFNDTGTGNDTGTSDDGGIDAPSPDQGCAVDDAGCENCCFNNHPDGAATYFDTLLTCACTKGATCHSASVCLNNFCQGNAPSATCDKCLANPDAGDCNNKANTACAGDNDCVALIDCLDNVCPAPPPADAGTD